MGDMTYGEWIDLYIRLTGWGLELDGPPGAGPQTDAHRPDPRVQPGVQQVRREEIQGLGGTESQRPALSTEVVDRYVIPEFQSGKSVFFFVIDCLRLDQWLVMEQVLQEYFTIAKEY